MENEKHKAMAEKEYPYRPDKSKDTQLIVKWKQEAFIAGLNKNEGLVKTIENLMEAVPKQTEDMDWWEDNLVKAMQEATEALTQYNSGEPSKLVKAATELLNLHMCEMEGLSQPTKEMWIKAVDNLSEALHPGK